MSSHHHIEIEPRAGGMTVGMPKSRYTCGCGDTGEWQRSGHHARQDFIRHGNDCDIALWSSLNACPVCEASFEINVDVCTCDQCKRDVCLICMESEPIPVAHICPKCRDAPDRP